MLIVLYIINFLLISAGIVILLGFNPGVYVYDMIRHNPENLRTFIS